MNRAERRAIEFGERSKKSVNLKEASQGIIKIHGDINRKRHHKTRTKAGMKQKKEAVATP